MKKILVETSARHIHVTRETLTFLFDENYELEVKKELSQPGQFATNTRLDIIGPKREILGVTILGPTRPEDQVEVSLTDARLLGVAAPIKESGDLEGSAPIKLRNPLNGRVVELSRGLIVAKRHIHMTNADAEELGVKNGEIVAVRLNTEERKAILEDVVVRVKDSFALAMHIDTDESNAANCKGEVFGEIVK